MTEGERAGWWAVAYLGIVLVATWFTIIALAIYYIRGWL